MGKIYWSKDNTKFLHLEHPILQGILDLDSGALSIKYQPTNLVFMIPDLVRFLNFSILVHFKKHRFTATDQVQRAKFEK